MIVQPGPVVDFLLANQNKKDPYGVDWNKVHHFLMLHDFTDELASLRSTYIFSYQARRVLKNLRVQVTLSNREYKISGLSEHSCKDQMYVDFI